MEGFSTYSASDIRGMSMSEYADFRDQLFSANYNMLWAGESYEYYLEKYVETGDEIYMARMLEKVTEES